MAHRLLETAARDALIRSFPEVESVVGKAGRAETATDYISMAFDPDLTKATTMAIQEMVDFLSDSRKLTKQEAYELVSIAGDVADSPADDFRFRLTGSEYATSRSVSNTLFSGDRAGSRYYDVLQNTSSTESAQASSGSIQPRESASRGTHYATGCASSPSTTREPGASDVLT